MKCTFDQNEIETRLKLPKNTIENFRKKGKTWDEIFYGCKENDSGLNAFINNAVEDYDWDITVDEWKQLVILLKDIEEHTAAGFVGDPKNPLKPVPENENSSWWKYKNKLYSKKFSFLSIRNIEDASKKVISHLKDETEQLKPVRGLVVGNVQSGKTANMAGVIALAQDYGYNFFIVLSGTIENLRKQTEERLASDLDNINCVNNLVLLRNLSPKSPTNDQLSHLSLDDDSNKRYLYVCLKNTGRLNDLLKWINGDKNKKAQLKILILDDEADQAGINTASIDKDLISKINKQIKALVFGKNFQFSVCSPYKCMNYIGYTATPYANFLNEADDKSLYPTNFIMTLNSPEEYIGPQQVFGIDDVNEGLPILNVISEDECTEIRENIPSNYKEIPNELKNAIYWFMCTVACFRYWKLNKPVSMLVHTSQCVPNHQQMGSLIETFINNLIDPISEIEKVYSKETKMLDAERFVQELPDFPDINLIKKYPSFDEIKPYLSEMIDLGTDHISLNADDLKLKYGKGIHLCIDNCYNNKVVENIVMRLIYPDSSDIETLKSCPAFIVVGGATLSRGLTLEGLTTTYFLRSTILGDTLMQMGRWFGFRKNYELLPRVWLSNGAIKQFKKLTLLDFDLREELHNMESLNLSPEQYGPRLDSFPDFKELKITANNKMQKSYEIIQDFANKKGQTTLFYGDESIIENNYDSTIEFINSLGPVDHSKIESLKNDFTSENSLIWFNKSYADVFDYLKKLSYPEQSATFGDVNETLKWFEEQFDKKYLNNFNIIVSSNSKESETVLKLDNVSINLPTRRKLKNLDENDTNINLKILTTPDDRLMDIDMSGFDKDEKDAILSCKNLSAIEKRVKFKDFNTPLLILYIVDKNSGKNKPITNDRLPLNLNQHLAGYFIYIPYGNNGDMKNSGNKNKKTVKLEFSNEGDVEGE